MNMKMILLVLCAVFVLTSIAVAGDAVEAVVRMHHQFTETQELTEGKAKLVEIDAKHG